MSSDNYYATHIVQKYRLALSIAIIKTKPECITLEDHIQQLINKLNPKDMERDIMNISIDSDDFVLDEDDNFLTNIVEINDKVNIDKTENEINGECNIQSQLNNVQIADTQNLNNSITILQNFDMENEYINKANSETAQRKSLYEVMDILNGIDDGIQCLEKVGNPSNLAQYDTQCFTDIEPPVSENFKPKDDQITNQSTKLLINNKETDSDSNKMQLSANNATDDKVLNKVEPKSKQYTKQNIEYDNKLNNVRSYRHTKEFKYIYQNIANVFGTKDQNLKDAGMVPMSDGLLILDNGQHTVKESQEIDKFNDAPQNQKSQAAMTHNLTQDLTCNTHYSQSQMNNIVTLDSKYIHSNKRNNNSCKDELNTSKKMRGDIIVVDDEVISINKQQGFCEITDTAVDSESNSKYTNKSKLFKQPLQSAQEARTIEVDTVTEKRPEHTQNSLFSQELPNVLIPTNKFQIFAKSNENRQTNIENLEQNTDKTNTIGVKQDKSKINNSIQNANFSMTNDYKLYTINNSTADTSTMNAKVNIPINKENVNETNAYRAVENIDTDLFSEESQLTYFTTFSINGFMPEISQDSLELPNRTKHRRIDDYKQETSVSTDFDSKIKTAQFRTADNPQKTQATFDKKYDDDKTFKKGTKAEVQESCADFKNYSMELTEHTNVRKINDQHQNIAPTESCNDFDDNLDVEEVTDIEEVVPFKIIEEMNKVKIYLSKRIDKNLSGREYSNDTGYKSDSSSMKTSQSSNAWVDQSAHSLLNYITDCPLVDNTEDITNEISVILGHLIDKLHEEEKYPVFLEDMLASIQGMLRLIYEDDIGENALTKKDEYIHRILLFNKSIHLQKYTIEKITQKLKNVHSELTSNDLKLETKNIHLIENTCYIFHLLEILLQRYNKTSQHLSLSNQNLSQETQCLSQNSQEDNLLKKTGIMDIWRKKWNPNFKETQNEDGLVKKECVISKCCIVLNKLVVECMEKYSLVSYCALKCFNVVQT